MKNRFLFLIIPFLLFNINLFSSVTSLNVQPVGSNGMYLEAQSSNNPVLHIGITTDSLGGTLTSVSVQNTLNSWGYGSAVSPTSISIVKLWYVPADSTSFNAASAQYVTFLSGTFDSSTSSYDLFFDNTFTWVVANGSGIWVTVDIPTSPAFSTMQMQTNSLTFTASSVSSSNAPSTPPVLFLTQNTPATNLLVSSTSGNMLPDVSTGQNNVISMSLHLYNNSGSASSPIVLNGLTITALASPAGVPGNVTIIPSSIISDIKIQDNDVGTIYGEISGRANLPSTTAPMEISLSGLAIPANTTINLNVIITITGVTNAAGTDFSLLINDPSFFYAYDENTSNPVSVSLTSFPILSTSATIQEEAAAVDAACLNIIPATINKGQTGIPLFDVCFSNPGPGGSLTAPVQIFNLELSVEDSNNNPVVPGSLFSGISVTDPTGAIVYGFQTSSGIGQTGSTINIPLTSMVIVPAASSITIAVSANILTSTAINNFKIGIQGNTDISARDNNFLSYAIPVSLTPSPFYSNLAILSSSFTVSHSAYMPANLYTGESGVHAIDFLLSPPLIYGTGNGNILITAMTLTALDSSGNPQNASDYISSISMRSVSQTANISSIPASPYIYIAFPSPVTIPSSGYTLSYYVDINSNVSANNLQLSLASASDISSYQNNELSRQIAITAAYGDSFPMSSGIGYIGGNTSSLSFSNYPNPFKAGSITHFTYYLSSDAKVTLKIFDIAGAYIATILDNSLKSSGSHNEDTWDGNDNKGHGVLAGTYLAQILVNINGKKTTSLRKVTFIK